MHSVQHIAARLWLERANYPYLQYTEFASLAALTTQVQYELQAVGSFADIEGARVWFAALDLATRTAIERSTLKNTPHV